MLAQARVVVLIEMRAVKIGQPVAILRKVRRHPVDDHANPLLMTLVHEVFEIVRRAESRRRGIVADRLIAPGSIERVFADRQHFDMREAHLFDVGDQGFRQLAIGQHPVVFIRRAAPGAQMHLVNAYRGIHPVVFLRLAIHSLSFQE